MKRKTLRTIGIILGVVIVIIILIGPATPLWVRLGMKPFCIQGAWPHLKFIPCESDLVGSTTVTPIATTDLMGQEPIPLIFDDDGSPDGVIALLYFLSNSNFDVKAITISQGEAHPDIFVGHLQQLLTRVGRQDIQVGMGRLTPLEGNNTFPDPWRQASDRFWDISLPSADGKESVAAARLIVETIQNSKLPVTIFVSGSHTNLAEALRLDPGIVDNIREVDIMGGSVYRPGNIQSDWAAIDNSVAEWNIWVDSLAAQEVFSAGLKLHLVPLDATNQVMWTQEDLSGITASNSPEGKLAGEVLQWMLNSWSKHGVYVWDLVTAVKTSNPSICPEVSLAIDIITEPGREQGRTKVVQGDPNTSVCLNPDTKQVKASAAFIFGQP